MLCRLISVAATSRAPSRRKASISDAQRAESGDLCLIYQRGLEAERRIAKGEFSSERERGGLEAIASAGRRAARKLTTDNFGLILKLVDLSCYGLVDGRVPSDDLIQCGVLGFRQGCSRFDPSRGIQLSTFVQYWIREAVRNAYRDDAGISGIHGGDLAISLKGYSDFLEREQGSARPEEVADLWNSTTVARYAAILAAKPSNAGVDDETIAARAESLVRRRGLWLTPERVLDAQRRLTQVASLDAPTEEDGETVGELITTGESVEDSVIDALDAAKREEEVEEALASALDQRSYLVVRMYFGLGLPSGMTHGEIAREMNITPAAAKRALEAALIALREHPALRALVGMR